jgi:hypothetical protein
MGRSNTGALTTGEIQRIELSYLIKQGLLRKGFVTNRALSWNDGSSIRIICSYTRDGLFIRLSYQATDSYTDEVTKFDYKIYLDEVPSNLGQGNVIYFICPQTGKRCRILYKCYGSSTWQSRFVYRKRIYYTSQLSSKGSSYNNMYWKYEEKIVPKLKSRIKNSHYRGEPTKAQKDYKRAINKRDYYDDMRFYFLELQCQEFIKG